MPFYLLYILFIPSYSIRHKKTLTLTSQRLPFYIKNKSYDSQSSQQFLSQHGLTEQFVVSNDQIK